MKNPLLTWLANAGNPNIKILQLNNYTVVFQTKSKSWEILRVKRNFLFRNSLEFGAWKMWILWKMRFLNCEFCEKLDFENVIFLKNEILKMWILWKMIFWKCEFCEKWDFENVNFVKSEILKLWILQKMRLWKCEFL